MRVPMKTRRTKPAAVGAKSATARVSVRFAGGRQATYKIPVAKVPAAREFLSNLAMGFEVKKAADEGVPADEVFADLYKDTSKPATVLRGFRARDEMTQAELAGKLGTNQANVAKMESGARPIGKEMAKKLAAIFKTDYRVFL
jgi:DNA-binding XRE family transcriptional regulator